MHVTRSHATKRVTCVHYANHRRHRVLWFIHFFRSLRMGAMYWKPPVHSSLFVSFSPIKHPFFHPLLTWIRQPSCYGAWPLLLLLLWLLSLLLLFHGMVMQVPYTWREKRITSHFTRSIHKRGARCN